MAFKKAYFGLVAEVYFKLLCFIKKLNGEPLLGSILNTESVTILQSSKSLQLERKCCWQILDFLE